MNEPISSEECNRRHHESDRRLEIVEIRIQSLQEQAAAALMLIGKEKAELLMKIQELGFRIDALAWKVGLIIGGIILVLDLVGRYLLPELLRIR